MPTLAEEKELYVVNESATNTEVSFRNPIRQLGFAQIEHVIGLDQALSDGAYRTLSILHYFWQRKKDAYPSIETLAKLRGKSERTISEHLAELEEKGIITRARRLGTSSMTYLEDLPQEYMDAAAAILQERKERKEEREKLHDDMRKTAPQSCEKLQVSDAKNCEQRITIEEEQEEEATCEKSLCWKEFQKAIESHGDIYGATRHYAEWNKTWDAYKDNHRKLRHLAGMAFLNDGKNAFKYFDEFRKFKVDKQTAPPLSETPTYQRNVKWANL